MEILTGGMKRFIHFLFYLSTGLLVFSLFSCSTKTEQEPSTKEEQTSTPVQKKILYSQRTQGGKNAINVIEEKQGH